MKYLLCLALVALSLQDYVVYPEGDHCYVKVKATTKDGEIDAFLKFKDRLYVNKGSVIINNVNISDDGDVSVSVTSNFSPCKKIKCFNSNEESYVCVRIFKSIVFFTVDIPVPATDDILKGSAVTYDTTATPSTFTFNAKISQEYIEGIIKTTLASAFAGDIGNALGELHVEYSLVYDETRVESENPPALTQKSSSVEYSVLTASNYSPDVEHLSCYGEIPKGTKNRVDYCSTLVGGSQSSISCFSDGKNCTSEITGCGDYKAQYECGHYNKFSCEWSSDNSVCVSVCKGEPENYPEKTDCSTKTPGKPCFWTGKEKKECSPLTNGCSELGLDQCEISKTDELLGYKCKIVGEYCKPDCNLAQDRDSCVNVNKLNGGKACVWTGIDCKAASDIKKCSDIKDEDICNYKPDIPNLASINCFWNTEKEPKTCDRVCEGITEDGSVCKLINEVNGETDDTKPCKWTGSGCAIVTNCNQFDETVCTNGQIETLGLTCNWKGDECKADCTEAKSKTSCDKANEMNGDTACLWTGESCVERTSIKECSKLFDASSCHEFITSSLRCLWTDKKCVAEKDAGDCNNILDEVSCTAFTRQNCEWDTNDNKCYKKCEKETEDEKDCAEIASQTKSKKCLWDGKQCSSTITTCKDGKSSDGCKYLKVELKLPCAWDDTATQKCFLSCGASGSNDFATCRSFEEKHHDSCVWDGEKCRADVSKCSELSTEDACEPNSEGGVSTIASNLNCEWVGECRRKCFGTSSEECDSVNKDNNDKRCIFNGNECVYVERCHGLGETACDNAGALSCEWDTSSNTCRAKCEGNASSPKKCDNINADNEDDECMWSGDNCIPKTRECTAFTRKETCDTITGCKWVASVSNGNTCQFDDGSNDDDSKPSSGGSSSSNSSNSGVIAIAVVVPVVVVIGVAAVVGVYVFRKSHGVGMSMELSESAKGADAGAGVDGEGADDAGGEDGVGSGADNEDASSVKNESDNGNGSENENESAGEGSGASAGGSGADA